jgi:rhamnose utilization protein RhaD (predicted bifunctional aldolase and dehydrogenase)
LEVNNIREAVEKFCTTIGSNPMLVQGAGGNISWKDGDTLWVKASGMWMADAEKKDIFVPIDLKNIKKEIAKSNYSVDIQTIALSELRPSIETILHSLMPHKIVLHVHAVETLAYLVTQNYSELLNSILKNTYNYAYVDYKKPGPDLAEAISKILIDSPGVQIIFLQNHGVVIGGIDIDEIDKILSFIECAAKDHASQNSNLSRKVMQEPKMEGYHTINDEKINKLVENELYFLHTKSNWALFPDHVVFLGGKSFCYSSLKEFSLSKEKPNLLFIRGIGVFSHKKLSYTQKTQLRCYCDVVSRLNPKHKINNLNESQIHELLNWNLEKHRVKNSK